MDKYVIFFMALCISVAVLFLIMTIVLQLQGVFLAWGELDNSTILLS